MKAKEGGYNVDMDLLEYDTGRLLRYHDIKELRKREICDTSILYVKHVPIMLDLTPLTREQLRLLAC